MLKWILFLNVWKSTPSHRNDGEKPRMTGLYATLLFPWYHSWNLSRQVPNLTKKTRKTLTNGPSSMKYAAVEWVQPMQIIGTPLEIENDRKRSLCSGG